MIWIKMTRSGSISQTFIVKKTLAIAVKKSGIDSCSQKVFKYAYISSTLFDWQIEIAKVRLFLKKKPDSNMDKVWE